MEAASSSRTSALFPVVCLYLHHTSLWLQDFPQQFSPETNHELDGWKSGAGTMGNAEGVRGEDPDVGLEQAEISGCSHLPGKFCLAFPEILPGLPSLAAMPPQLGFLGILLLPCIVKCANRCVSGGQTLFKLFDLLVKRGSVVSAVALLLQRNAHLWGVSENHIFMSCRG